MVIFVAWIAFIVLEQKINLDFMNVKIWISSMQNKDCYGITMPSEKDNILEFNQYMKPDKMLYIT